MMTTVHKKGGQANQHLGSAKRPPIVRQAGEARPAFLPAVARRSHTSTEPKKREVNSKIRTTRPLCFLIDRCDGLAVVLVGSEQKACGDLFFVSFSALQSQSFARICLFFFLDVLVDAGRQQLLLVNASRQQQNNDGWL